jgi:hypothetical protein
VGGFKVKKFLVLGGHLGDAHGKPKFVAAAQLVPLYGLNPDECLCLDSMATTRGHEVKGLIILRPVPDGNYREALARATRRMA